MSFYSRPARLRSLGALFVFAAFAACGDDDDDSPNGEPDASERADAGATNDGGGTTGRDASDPTDDSDGETPSEDAGCEATNTCGEVDPLAPFALNCKSLPSDGVCQGGPHEVLLVSEAHGLILMFEPSDGSYLGSFKRPGQSYYIDGQDDLLFATQGPDQCIWSVSEDDAVRVQRWNTDGSYRDSPLKPHSIEITDARPEDAIDTPLSIAFSRDRLYVSSSYGTPEPRITRWTLDGEFDGVALDDGTEAESMVVLGDGSLLIADGNNYGLLRVPADGGPAKSYPVELSGPGQVSYAGDGKVLIAETGLGEPIHSVDLASDMVRTIYPNSEYSSNKYGLVALGDGRWMLTGGQFGVVALDPMSSNPPGQYTSLFEDPGVAFGDFKMVGRACLSEEFIASRAPSEPNNTCIAPPSGPAILEQNFESGDFTGTGSARRFAEFQDRGLSGVTSTLESVTVGSETTRALRIAGARVYDDDVDSDDSIGTDNAIYVTLPASQPKYVSYRVRIGANDDSTFWVSLYLGRFALGNSAVKSREGKYARLLSSYGENDTLYVDNAATSVTELGGRWVRIEMRDIDWDARTFDLYVDCKRLAENVTIPPGYGDSIDVLDLYNYADTTALASSPSAVAWFDDILIK